MTTLTYYREAELKPGGDGREFSFLASDETVDSYGDIVRVEGWDLKRYKSNPIVLFGHSNSLPIGSAKVELDKAQKQLRCVVKMAAEGTSEFIDTLVKLMQQKIVKAVSVGFKTTKTPNVLRDDEGHMTGLEFIGQELLEISVCSVPANPNSLSLAKQLTSKEMIHERLFATDTIVQAANDARARAIKLRKLGATGITTR